MHQMLRLVAVIAAALLAFPIAVPAQVAGTQMQLTDKQVEGFIAAQNDVSAVLEKMQAAAFSGEPDAKYRAEAEAIAKKNGFKNFAEYEAVAANISMVMAGIDPQTGVFTDAKTEIRKEIENARTDKTIPDRQRKALLKELNEALKSVEAIEFPSNIGLVQKYHEKITTINIPNHEDGTTTPTIVRTMSE